MLENNDQNIKMKYDVSEVLCTYKVKTRSEHRVKVSKDIIQEELDINIKNITREDDLRTLVSNVTAETSSEQRDETCMNNVKEKFKVFNCEYNIQKGSEFACYYWDAVYRYKSSLYPHIKSIYVIQL